MADARGATARSTRQVRVPRRGADLAAAAVAIAIAAIVTACASGDSTNTASTSGATTTIVVTSTSAAPTSTAVASTTVAPSATPSPVTAPPSTAAPIDPAATLQQGIAGLGASYHFTTTATVDGATVLAADGDRIDDGQRFAVTANDATVQYVITPDGTWVQQAGQEWQQLDDPPATADPIAALGAPTSVVLAGTSGPTITLTVAVPATALGVSADGDVPLTATVTDGVLGAVSYATTVGGKPAAVQASFGPPADATPVTAPT
jgi:hypothetical protein